MRLQWLGKLKKFSVLIENQTRDLRACSVVTQPTTLQLARNLSESRPKHRLSKDFS
jgi:hypothetical protein